MDCGAELEFDKWVSLLLEQVEQGQVTTFGDIAAALGDPVAARAVGRRMCLQPLGYRVVYADLHVPKEHRLRLGEEVDISGGCVSAERAVLRFPGIPPLERMRREQEELAARVRLKPCSEPAWAGFDVAYRGETAVGVLATAEEHEVEEWVPPIPYIPTYLAYREVGVFEKLVRKVDAAGPVLIDGNGILHPRRFGTACMAGVSCGVPTIGVAKSLLCGEVWGDKVLLDGEQVGWAIRPGPGVKNPVYVSPGHLTDLESCKTVVLSGLKHRIPGLLRKAHTLAGSHAADGR